MGLKSFSFHLLYVGSQFAPYMGLKRTGSTYANTLVLFAPYMGLKSQGERYENKRFKFAPYMGLKSS